MRQALLTRFLAPTDTRGARVSVLAQRGRKIYAWDHALNTCDNHARAATEAATSWDWLHAGDTLIGGALPSGSGYAFVIA